MTKPTFEHYVFDAERRAIADRIRQKAQALADEIDSEVGGRYAALAFTHIEIAVSMAVKGLGVPESQAGVMDLPIDHGPIPTYDTPDRR